jgi:hypothetical protein
MCAAEMVMDQGKTWLAQAGLSQSWQALLDELYLRKAAN